MYNSTETSYKQSSASLPTDKWKAKILLWQNNCGVYIYIIYNYLSVPDNRNFVIQATISIEVRA